MPRGASRYDVTPPPTPHRPPQAYLAALAATKLPAPERERGRAAGGGKAAPLPTAAAAIAAMPPPSDVGKLPTTALHGVLHTAGPELLARADAALARVAATLATPLPHTLAASTTATPHDAATATTTSPTPSDPAAAAAPAT
jgi:hypothetical protein